MSLELNETMATVVRMFERLGASRENILKAAFDALYPPVANGKSSVAPAANGVARKAVAEEGPRRGLPRKLAAAVKALRGMNYPVLSTTAFAECQKLGIGYGTYCNAIRHLGVRGKSNEYQGKKWLYAPKGAEWLKAAP
jgi:hypothetical protein